MSVRAFAASSRCRAAVERESAFRLLARSARSVACLALKEGRAALYGAFLTVAAKLRGPDGAQSLVLFRRKGKRAFEAEKLDAEQ